MAILVEFYGIPRIRAGVDRLVVLHDRDSASLGEVLQELAAKLPDFGETCLRENHLVETFIASIDGETFASNESTTIMKNQTVLILSTDAGG